MKSPMLAMLQRAQHCPAVFVAGRRAVGSDDFAIDADRFARTGQALLSEKIILDRINRDNFPLQHAGIGQNERCPADRRKNDTEIRTRTSAKITASSLPCFIAPALFRPSGRRH